jgi:hypothetical protein
MGLQPIPVECSPRSAQCTAKHRASSRFSGGHVLKSSPSSATFAAQGMDQESACVKHQLLQIKIGPSNDKISHRRGR